MASLDTIPSIYWIQLAWLDPLLSFGTMLQALFAPDVLFAIYLPRHLVATVPFPPLYRPLLHHVGAWYLFHTIVSGATPRITRDRNVWKMLQAAMLSIDSCSYGTFMASLRSRAESTRERGRWGNWPAWLTLLAFGCSGCRLWPALGCQGGRLLVMVV
ncbi:hypothetical protein RB594_007186 [Gaeumannomyces avenae]